MAKFWDILKPGDREKLAQLYEQLTRVEFIPPKRGDRPIQCETKIESLEEIDKLMKEKPGYSVDVQGREG